MAILSFEDLAFQDVGDFVKVIFYNRFYLCIPKRELEVIAPFCIEKKAINFDCIKNVDAKFYALLTKYLSSLKSLVTNNPAVYIHKNSGIPLIGNSSFGLVYRNTSIIEVKPQTTCNLDCVYCSVGEGLSSRQTDFVVERDYLMQEFKDLLTFVDSPVEVHIGVQGEPFLYKDLILLIKDLSGCDLVKVISMDTNGTLLTEEIIDRLSCYSKVRINVSLNSMDSEVAKKLANAAYNHKHVVDMIRYAASKIDVLVAPLIVPGFNEGGLLELVEFVKSLPEKVYPLLGVQNFLAYRTGRSPTKKLFSWDEFRSWLKEMEVKTGYKLLLDFQKDFQIKSTKVLCKPFKKGQRVLATIVSLGRFPNTKLAVAGDRNITVFSCDKVVGSKVWLRILRSKHNIFLAKEL